MNVDVVLGTAAYQHPPNQPCQKRAARMHHEINYATYLALPELLDLQRPLSDGPEHDEMLFIVIHQVYELWFKQVLHETDLLHARLDAHDSPAALFLLRRMLTILKTMVGQVDILETMTPLSFASFRPRLESASGFQSWQFRELEAAMGKRLPRSLTYYPEGTYAHARLSARFQSPTLYESLLRFIQLQGYTLPAPEELVLRDPQGYPCPCEALHPLLIHIYRHDPITSQICERFVDLDEGFQEWRYRHVKMVERTIGTKSGTGGSSGAAYLKSTLFQPFFPDLWAIRADL